MGEKSERWAFQRIRDLERTIRLLRTQNYKLRLQRDRAKARLKVKR